MYLLSLKDFKYGMRKNFLLAVYEKNYTVLNDEGINYMVKGLNENLDQSTVKWICDTFRATMISIKEKGS